jgi:hypothetical protein
MPIWGYNAIIERDTVAFAEVKFLESELGRVQARVDTGSDPRDCRVVGRDESPGLLENM